MFRFVGYWIGLYEISPVHTWEHVKDCLDYAPLEGSVEYLIYDGSN